MSVHDLTLTGNVTLAVRIKNARYDGMVTGWLHGGVTFTKADEGGFISASFTLDYRLGFRDDILVDYTRCYIMDRRTGYVVFEGDITHPGRQASQDGQTLNVQVDGSSERLSDWSGARIFIDRDMEAWKLTNTATTGTLADVMEDRGGSGSDSLTLAFPNSFHVETNYRSEVGYFRIIEAGQVLGYFNYNWDGGHTSGDPGWIVRSIGTPPSTVIRSQVLNVGGSGGSGAVWGGSIIDGMNTAYLQLIWTGGSSNTGTLDNVWVSFKTTLLVTAKLFSKDGGFKSAGSYIDTITAQDVVGDLLGDILADSMDGTDAQVDVGAGTLIRQMAYPDGVTPKQVLQDLMKLEPSCTYRVGASDPTNDLYRFQWIERSTVPRYEAMVWVDQHESGTQQVDQYNRAVARWRTPIGNLRITVSTQTIPEMDAVGRTRTFFQDLSNTLGITENATQANATILEEHRYPQNTGRLTIERPVLDLWTGRYVQPYEVEPGCLIRLVGLDPNPDALNAATANGVTVCRIVQTDYDGGKNAVDCDLDGIPLSLLRAIMNTRKNRQPVIRRV